jgi:hypothetical protein
MLYSCFTPALLLIYSCCTLIYVYIHMLYLYDFTPIYVLLVLYSCFTCRYSLLLYFNVYICVHMIYSCMLTLKYVCLFMLHLCFSPASPLLICVTAVILFYLHIHLYVCFTRTLLVLFLVCVYVCVPACWASRVCGAT